MQNKRLSKENVLTIPNMLSLFRLLLIPLIVWLYCGQKKYKVTIAVVALSGATDIIDGKIARKFNMVSDVGKVLDPIADKLTQMALVICLASRYKWMWALLVLFAIKECFMALWGFLALKFTDTVNSAKWYGKACTVVLYTVMMILILFADIPQTAANVLIIICAAAMLISLILYGRFYYHILKQTRESEKLQKIMLNILKIVLVFVWLAIILICIFRQDDISIESILRYTPKNPWLAALLMMALFALKSLSIVIYSGILYVADGILFPMPVAFLVNLCGTMIMFSLPYFIGKNIGASAVNYIREKYPKTEAIHKARSKNDVFFAYIVRMVRIPSDIASLYMGAINVNYKRYLLGSLLGMLPHMIIYPIIGMSASDISSPAFIISLCAELAYIIITTLIYAGYRKKHERRNE